MVFSVGFRPDSTFNNGGSDGWIAKVFTNRIDLHYSGYTGGDGFDSVVDIDLMTGRRMLAERPAPMN
jgi:hypothetical protein